MAKPPVKATRAPRRAPAAASARALRAARCRLTRRIPKRGFTNIYAKEYATVNVGSLEIFEDGTVVTVALLKEAGLVKQVLDGVKILGGGELTKKLTVQVTKYTQSAKEKIEAVGGKAEVI